MTQSDGVDDDPRGPVDWRGTPITPGALVIYGAPVGRSIALVEATVADPMLTPSGRIWLDVIRRAYGGWGDSKRRVHVGADRLTVVDILPPTTMPTDVEKHAEKTRQWAARGACLDGVHEREQHPGPPTGYEGPEREPGETYRPRRWVTCDLCTLAAHRFDAQWAVGHEAQTRAALGQLDGPA